MSRLPEREIRAVFDESTVRVYQAYNAPIAKAAVAAGTLAVPGFKRDRMTWIKPSFLWMMYRSGWGRKDAGQSNVLAIDISRSGFEWALAHSCGSGVPDGMTRDEARRMMDEHPVRVQWDPERDLHHNPLPHRSIQVGLKGEALDRYLTEWIRGIEDVTHLAHEIERCVADGRGDDARARLPSEQAYSPPEALRSRVGGSATTIGADDVEE